MVCGLVYRFGFVVWMRTLSLVLVRLVHSLFWVVFWCCIFGGLCSCLVVRLAWFADMVVRYYGLSLVFGGLLAI